MKRMLAALAMATLIGAVATAQDEESLNGKRVTVTAGDTALNWTPVSIPVTAQVGDDAVIDMVQEGTGKEFPATLKDGVLTFVPEGSAAGKTLTYAVRVKKFAMEPAVKIEPGDEKDTLTVTINDEHFTTFHYSHENRKPFLWPVLGAGGVPLTRAFPMGEKELKADHPHHKSFWTAYGNINGVRCWEEDDEAGSTYASNVKYGSGRAYGWITADVSWESVDGKVVLTESREYRFYNTPAEERFVDVKVDLEAPEDALFGDTKEGGIVSFRMRDTMTEQNGGTITLSDGRSGAPNCWGKASPWCDYSAPVDDAGVHGIAVFDNANNLRYPTRWHVRDYGLMGANPFGLSYFTEGDEHPLNGDYLLPKGEHLVFNYRVYIHSFDVEKSGVADRYDNYLHGPSVAWAQ